jgi:coenzyme F420-0:L-glutamate ligase/coenzyme F420-1:gamma-L-glutamate ligase
MFSLGTAEARAAGLRAAATLPTTELRDAVDAGAADRALATVAGAVDRALATVAGVVAAGTVITREDGGAVLHLGPADAGATGFIRLGADAHRLRAALAAEGVASEALIRDDGVWVRVTA